MMLAPSFSLYQRLLRWQILDKIPTGIFVRDATGQLVMCNEAARQLVGLTDEQLTGQEPNPPGWFVTSESGEPLSRDQMPSRQALRTGVPVIDGVYAIHKPHGAITWLLNSSYPLGHDEHGRPEGVFSTLADFTHRKRASDLAQTLFDHVSDAVLMTVPGERILSANKAACDLLRASEADLVAVPGGLNALTGGLEIDPGPRILMDTGQFKGEITVRRLDGSILQADVSAVLFTDRLTGEPRSATMLRDAAPRKEAERLVREQARLDGVLLGVRTLQHQLNNQMGIVAGYVDLVRAEMRNHPDLAPLLDEAIAAAHKSSALINQLGQINQIVESDQPNARFATIDVSRSIQ